MNPLDQETRINLLMYGLGLAIGAMEAIKSNPHHIQTECVEAILRKLYSLVDPQFFVSLEPPPEIK